MRLTSCLRTTTQRYTYVNPKFIPFSFRPVIVIDDLSMHRLSTNTWQRTSHGPTRFVSRASSFQPTLASNKLRTISLPNLYFKFYDGILKKLHNLIIPTDTHVFKFVESFQCLHVKFIKYLPKYISGLYLVVALDYLYLSRANR